MERQNIKRKEKEKEKENNVSNFMTFFLGCLLKYLYNNTDYILTPGIHKCSHGQPELLVSTSPYKDTVGTENLD